MTFFTSGKESANKNKKPTTNSNNSAHISISSQRSLSEPLPPTLPSCYIYNFNVDNHILKDLRFCRMESERDSLFKAYREIIVAKEKHANESTIENQLLFLKAKLSYKKQLYEIREKNHFDYTVFSFLRNKHSKASEKKIAVEKMIEKLELIIALNGKNGSRFGLSKEKLSLLYDDDSSSHTIHSHTDGTLRFFNHELRKLKIQKFKKEKDNYYKKKLAVSINPESNNVNPFVALKEMIKKAQKKYDKAVKCMFSDRFTCYSHDEMLWHEQSLLNALDNDTNILKDAFTQLNVPLPNDLDLRILCLQDNMKCILTTEIEKTEVAKTINAIMSSIQTVEMGKNTPAVEELNTQAAHFSSTKAGFFSGLNLNLRTAGRSVIETIETIRSYILG